MPKPIVSPTLGEGRQPRRGATVTVLFGGTDNRYATVAIQIGAGLPSEVEKRRFSGFGGPGALPSAGDHPFGNQAGGQRVDSLVEQVGGLFNGRPGAGRHSNAGRVLDRLVEGDPCDGVGQVCPWAPKAHGGPDSTQRSEKRAGPEVHGVVPGDGLLIFMVIPIVVRGPID